MKFSTTEIKDLVKGWIAVSIAFGIVLSTDYTTIEFVKTLLISFITVGLGFILHELAHKYFAQQYRCWAEFRSFDFMLILAVAMSFFGFVFAAPGAVMIQGHITKKQNGIISMAGPLMNLVLAVLLLPLFYFTTGIIHDISFYGFSINAFLGVFNLIPFGPFDGTKIFEWNKLVWGGMLLVGVGLLIVRMI